MVQLKFSFREWTLDKAALSVAQLASLVVTPEEKCSIVENGDAVSSAAGKVGHMDGPLVGIEAVVQVRNIFN